MTTRICVSILPKTITETRSLIEEAEQFKADFIEVRLDRLKEHDGLIDITSHIKTPMIAANRSPEHKGDFSGTEIERQDTLLDAARHGFEYVDLELTTPKLKNLVRKMRQTKVKLIISFHDFEKTPPIARLHEILQKETTTGADLCKIVTTAASVKDNLTVLGFLSETQRKHNMICFCMGKLGKTSRFLSPLFGAFFTIASLRPGKETAEGQLPIQEMRRAYDALEMM
ncbi:MAG TPA: type I 3-dehydroquinate dehydratase [Candidatus Bathyarchaeia archaeon]|nr:type I 3-dehydroquinate dehydratase [Candidatus Bathyarchaeia archaeon]